MTTLPRPSMPTYALLLTAAVAGAGCQGARERSLRDADYPGTLQAPARLATEGVWQQHVTATWRDQDGAEQERGFDAAIQRRGDELTVVGLSPMGSVGFSITQGPAGVEVVNHIPDQMVIPPRFILLDVQRAFFPWCAQDARPAEAGEVVTEVDGEQVAERWDRGRLVERTFTRTSGAPEGAIRVAYEWGRGDWALPERAVLDNGWFGYRLTIVTSSETRLESAGER